MGIFEEYSEYYDALYGNKDYSGETAYVVNLIQAYRPGSVLLLDLGCGTGKHLALFREAGFDVKGIDLSEKMIRLAKERNPSIPFETGDARTIRLVNRFDVVTSLFHVASYQNTEEDLSSLFRSACFHLYKGGVFIFDVWHAPAVLSDGPQKRIKEVETSLWQIVRNTEPVVYPVRNVIDVKFTFDIYNKKDGIRRNIKEVHSMRYWYPIEIKSNLENEGFRLLKVEEWMTGNPVSEKTWYVTYVAEKL